MCFEELINVQYDCLRVLYYIFIESIIFKHIRFENGKGLLNVCDMKRDMKS